MNSFFFPKAQVEMWRKEYGGKAPLEDVIRQQLIPERKLWILHYFEKMGIAAEIIELMDSAPSTDLRLLSQSELVRLGLVTESQVVGQSVIDQLTK